jgi:hypothetical protein
MSLMLTAPRLVVDAPVAPSAVFDPPVIAPGGQSVYRVTLHTLEEAITRWPDKMPAPATLKLTRGAQGQTFNMAGGAMAPITVVNFHATAAEAGDYVIPAFTVEIYGKPVTIPEARLQVSADNTTPSVAHHLLLQTATTNVYVGQTIRLRVLNVAAPDRIIQVISQVALNGDGFLTGKGDVRQQISPFHLPNGNDLPAFIYDTAITPFAQGPLKISAQGFTAGNIVNGQLVIRGGVTIPGGPPDYSLLESDPIVLNVRPLPSTGRLAGFNGAIGKFSHDRPQLNASSVPVGTPIKLLVTFHSDGTITHLAAPEAPSTPAWQSFATGSPVIAGNSATFIYTFIPQTEQTFATPEIPFSCFDPDTGKYVDLSIPAMPIKVLPGPAPAGTNQETATATTEAPEKKLALSAPAPAMGRTTVSLVPLQQRPGFLLLELVPVLGLFIVWLVSRRRYYLEQHPDLVRRRQARRSLRQEWKKLQQAARSGDSSGFATSAVQALRVASAPHFPAEPRALVCGDILQVLPETDRNENSQMVRRLFTATDTLNFAVTSGEVPGLLEWQPQLERLLAQLEAQL